MQISHFIQRGRALLQHSHQQGSAHLSKRATQQLGREWLQASEKQLKRQKRLLLLILLLLTALVIRFLLPLQMISVPATHSASHTGPAPSATAGNGASTPFCGIPTAVFTHFGIPANLTPSISQLAQLPAPAASGTSTQPLTYDPATNQLCAQTATDLTAQFFPPQSAGGGTGAAIPSTPSIDINPVQWALDALQAVEETIVQTIDTFLLQQIQALGFVTNTDPNLSYNNPTIQSLNAWLVTAIAGMLALAFVVTGYHYMFGYYRHGWAEFVPRMIACAVLAAFSLPLLGMFIDLVNSAIADFQTALAGFPPNIPNNPVGIIGIIYLIELVAILILLLQMLIRIAILDVLLVLAPLGIMCYALPQTRPWGRMWSQAFVSALVVQPLQIMTVGIGAALIGALGQNGSIIGAFVGIGMIYVAWRIPGMLLSNALRAMNSVTRDTLGALEGAAQTTSQAVAYLAA